MTTERVSVKGVATRPTFRRDAEIYNLTADSQSSLDQGKNCDLSDADDYRRSGL